MPSLRTLRPYLRFTLRSLTVGATLLCVYFGSAGAAYYAHQNSFNRATALRQPLPSLPAPTSATRLMVFAPHCDDETLGNAGLIQRTKAAGGAVQTVIFTNGDGYPTTVQRETRRLRLEPADYVRFGTLRQQESRAAMKSLGVEADETVFLGYPDQGLLALWNSNWLAETPFASAFTHRTASPYETGFHRSAVYCGQNVLEDVKRAMRDYRPTLITVTHPEEDHSDHAAAAAFVMLALQELRQEPTSADWASRAELRHYLVHRGDWPPRPIAENTGQAKRIPMTPPAAMRGQDTEWRALNLSPEQRDGKAKAIALYASQTVMMERFLSAFVTSNEIFGEIRPALVPQVRDGSIQLKADTTDWQAIQPALLDPTDDNMIRSMEGGADIRSVSVCRESQTLFLRVDTRTNLNSRTRFYFVLRPFGENGDSSGSALGFVVQGRSVTPHLGLRSAMRGNLLEVALPLERLTRLLKAGRLTRLALSIDTSIAGVGIDRTGIRLLELTERLP